jgi:hypothetical protein
MSSSQNNVVTVSSPTHLPYSYIPFHTVEQARLVYPDATLYVYVGIAPKGWQIVAYPITMTKPEEEETNV